MSTLLARDRSVLCVVDIQTKLAAVMADRMQVIENTRRLALAARRLGVPVIVTEQYPKGLGPTEPSVIEALGEGCSPISKMAFSCCGEDAFGAALDRLGRKQVTLCGMEAHVCVLQTCLGLIEKGYEAQVAADAVCSRNPEHRAIALEQMRQAGAVVTSAESVIFQWLGVAGTPEFKDVLKLVK